MYRITLGDLPVGSFFTPLADLLPERDDLPDRLDLSPALPDLLDLPDLSPALEDDFPPALVDLPDLSPDLPDLPERVDFRLLVEFLVKFPSKRCDFTNLLF